MTDTQGLRRTPLHALHVELGARMTGFAGYDMPLNYGPGVMKEHVHTRTQAGLFDVSHMGQIEIRARSGRTQEAALALERLVPMDILGLKEGRQRYAFFTNESGGIEDDLMVTNRGDHLFLVVNAACKEADADRLIEGLTECDVTVRTDRALLALQGPRAAEVLGDAVADLKFMDVAEVEIAGHPCLVSRSGYTGEDGFEISVADIGADALAKTLLAHEAVEPIGLGARDSLRLEAGLCLYGSDIDSETSPVEAALEWAIQKSRRSGGARAGGFPGAARILKELDEGASRRRVGLSASGRAPIRAGTPLFASDDSDEAIGTVTSGAFGPTVEAPVAMGYVPADMAEPGTVLSAELRGKRVAAEVAKLPFTPANFKR